MLPTIIISGTVLILCVVLAAITEHKATLITCVALIIISIIVLLSAANGIPFRKNKKINPGQIWVKEYNLNNPFQKPTRDTIIILDVKNGYAKYTKSGDTASEKCELIPANARLIKE